MRDRLALQLSKDVTTIGVKTRYLRAVSDRAVIDRNRQRIPWTLRERVSGVMSLSRKFRMWNSHYPPEKSLTASVPNICYQKAVRMESLERKWGLWLCLELVKLHGRVGSEDIRREPLAPAIESVAK